MISSKLKSAVLIYIISSIENCIINQACPQYQIQLNSFKSRIAFQKEAMLHFEFIWKDSFKTTIIQIRLILGINLYMVKLIQIFSVYIIKEIKELKRQRKMKKEILSKVQEIFHMKNNPKRIETAAEQEQF